MAEITAPVVELQPAARRTTGHWTGVMRRVVRSRSGRIGMFVLAFHLLIALSAPLIVPYDPVKQDSTQILKPPSREHPFGTDRFGRDVFSRVIVGGRTAIVITLVAAVIALTWGGTFGILLGFQGGLIDEIGMRLIDALLALPSLPFLLLAVTIFGNNILMFIPVWSFFTGIGIVRVARAATLSFVAQDFVAAARARGDGSWRIIRRELLPNTLDVLFVEGAMRWSWNLIGFSSLSFLGFGVMPPTPDWGLMIAESRTFLAIAPWISLYPIVAISSLVIAINLTSDALSKAIGLDQTQGLVQ